MFFIPGWLISILTFPGVIVHEMAHQIFCRWARVAVLDVCYFRVGNPAGYVVHESPRTAGQSLLIGIGPFLVNTLVGALIAAPATIPFRFESFSMVDLLLLYLGVSIAMHAFPSTGDAKSIWHSVMQPGVNPALKAITVPILGFIYLGALGSMFWLDAIYGVFVATALPLLLISLMA